MKVIQKIFRSTISVYRSGPWIPRIQRPYVMDWIRPLRTSSHLTVLANCQTELIVSTPHADGTGDEDSDRRMRNAFIQLAGTDPGGYCRNSYL